MEKLELNISVKQLADLKGHKVTCIIHSLGGKRYLNKEYSNLRFSIHYPLDKDKAVEIVIPKAKSIADILVPLADTYKNVIYKDPKKYGVWGHCIEDLFFEGIVIKPNGICELFVGS